MPTLIQTLQGMEITDGLPTGTNLANPGALNLVVSAADTSLHSVEFWENSTTDDATQSDRLNAATSGGTETNDFLKVGGVDMYVSSAVITYRRAFVRTDDGQSVLRNFAFLKVSENSTATTVNADSVVGADDRVFVFVADLNPNLVDASVDTFANILDGTSLNNLWIWDAYSTQTFQRYSTMGDIRSPCFTSGTWLDGADGPVLVEDVAAGDLLMTRDDFETEEMEPSRVVWSFRRHLSAEQLRERPALYPVRIVAGALGGGLPTRDLLVSRQHRVLVRSRIAQRMFGVSEVLVAAIKLVDMPGIFIDTDVTEVEYFHLLFEDHKIVFAEGAPVESFYLGDEALISIGDEAVAELVEIFGDDIRQAISKQPAKTIPKGKLQKKLIARHAKNQQPVWGAEL